MIYAASRLEESALTEAERKAASCEPLPITWHAEIQGNVVRIFRQNVKVIKPPECDRSAIGPWSMQSRMRMLRVINKIDYAKIDKGLFVTLTYPDRVRRAEYKERTNDRSAFIQKVERLLKCHVPTLWRIEWEERKSGAYTGKLAPHFHLMMFGVKYLSWQWIRQAWREVLKAGDGPLVTHVKRIYNEDGACRYLSKYVSKYRSLDICTYLNSGIKFGRHWGLTRDEDVPMTPIAVARQLETYEIQAMKRFAAKKWVKYSEYDTCGFTLLGEKWAKRFTDFLK